MMTSMTGFSAVTGEARGFKFRIEARSLNHRFFEMKIRLPAMLFGLDLEIETLAKKYFERGKLELMVEVEAEPQDLSFSWSRPLAKAYLKTFEELKDELGLRGGVDLELLLSQKDVIISGPDKWGKQYWPELEPLFSSSFEALVKARRAEGARLESELRKHLDRIGELREMVKGRQDQSVGEFKAKLEKKIEKLLADGVQLDEGRLEQEVALLASRSDIAEELERISSHLKQFRLELETEGPKGKKLDFLLQELNREFNTVASKNQNAELAYAVVEAKSELERIRQQVQNIE